MPKNLNINNLSLKSLEKIFLVLDDIRYNVEIQNKTTWLDMGQVEGIEGVPKDEHKKIMTTLISNGGFLKERPANGDCCLDIDVEKFMKFFGQIIKQIEKLKTGNVPIEKSKKELKYDQEKGILSINGFDVQVSLKDKITVAQNILEYIFVNNAENIKDDFYYAEIAFDKFGDEGFAKNANAWRKYYTACMDIQDKIRKQTTGKIDDFLNYNSSKQGYVKINPKYLV